MLCRGKRTQPATPQRSPKRSRVSSVRRNLAGTPSGPSPADVSQFHLRDDTDSDTDDDIVILENASTPKPQKPSFDVTRVKKEEEEPSDANNSVSLESNDDTAVDDASAGTSATDSAAAGASSSPAPAPELTNNTTQTEPPTVKMEVESQNEREEEVRTVEMSTSDVNGNEQSAQAADDVCGAEQRVIKQESAGVGDAQGDDAEKHVLQREETPHVKNDEVAGPSHPGASPGQHSPLHIPSFTEVQKQQDQLLEILELTAKERDCFKERVDELNTQLQDMQNRLQELSQRNDRECSHQASQTEENAETKSEVDYKTLFEKANQKVDELIKDKEALLAAGEGKCNNGQNEERDMDEVLLQVDSLMREVDQRQKENHDLRSQVSVPVAVSVNRGM